MNSQTKPKKLTLSELHKKHGVPSMTKAQRDAALLIPNDGDFKERSNEISKVVIRRLRDLEVIERSPRLTCCCGSMLWIITPKGRSIKAGIIALNKERKEQDERALQPS